MKLKYEGNFDQGIYKIKEDGKEKTLYFGDVEAFNKRHITHKDEETQLKAQKLKSGTVRLYSELVHNKEEYRSKYYTDVNIPDTMFMELRMKGIITVLED
jgi:hypothetical protein